MMFITEEYADAVPGHEEIELALDPEKIHVFDKDTEQAIVH